MTKLVKDNVMIKGSRIAYGIYGSGVPVVLIHGTPFFSHIWIPVLPKLIAAGYKVHIYDLLGFGYSERPQDQSVDTSVSGQLPILLALLEHWGISQSHIVAHDIGGAIAQQLGIFHADKIQSLSLLDCVSFDSWPSKRTRKQMEAGLSHLMHASHEDHRSHFSSWLLSAAYNKSKLKHESLNIYLDMISGPVGQASLFQHQILHYDPIHTMKISAKLHELGKLPVQIIWGKEDHWQISDWAYRLNQAIPGSSLHLLESCGHLLTEDQPDKLCELLLAHIAVNR